MTEETAKSKWCPFSTERNRSILASIMSVIAKDDNALKIIAKADIIDKCIASDCMMWRNDPNLGSNISGFCGLSGFNPR